MKIVLIDSHKLLAHSLASLIREYAFVDNVWVFESVDLFIEAEDKPNPDVIVTDAILPEINGLDFIETLKKVIPSAKVIILSDIEEAPTIRQAFIKGADGYLSKSASPQELKEALSSVVFEDETYIGENLRKSLIRSALIEDRIVYNLSPREKEVLNLVCTGKTIKEVAFDMNLSINTVQTYYKGILRKFNLNRTVDLIVFAMQNGLYHPKPKSK